MGSGDASGPPNDKRLPDTALVELALAAAKRRVGRDLGFAAVIAGEDQNRVIRQAEALSGGAMA